MKSNAAWQRKNRFAAADRAGQSETPVLQAAQAPSPLAIGGTRVHPLTEAIQERWSLFGEGDLHDVRTRQELVAALQAKYRITEEQAAAQVADWVADNG
jgi:hypothetical protein